MHDAASLRDFFVHVKLMAGTILRELVINVDGLQVSAFMLDDLAYILALFVQ